LMPRGRSTSPTGRITACRNLTLMAIS
jgi:hypothetical protein